MMEETKVLLEVNEDSSQRGGCWEAGENQRADRPAKHTGPSYSCPWSSPIFPTLIRLLLWVFGVLSWAWASSPPPRLLSSSSSRQKQSSGRLMRPLPYFQKML